MGRAWTRLFLFSHPSACWLWGSHKTPTDLSVSGRFTNPGQGDMFLFQFFPGVVHCRSSFCLPLHLLSSTWPCKAAIGHVNFPLNTPMRWIRLYCCVVYGHIYITMNCLALRCILLHGRTMVLATAKGSIYLQKLRRIFSCTALHNTLNCIVWCCIIKNIVARTTNESSTCFPVIFCPPYTLRLSFWTDLLANHFAYRLNLFDHNGILHHNIIHVRQWF